MPLKSADETEAKAPGCTVYVWATTEKEACEIAAKAIEVAGVNECRKTWTGYTKYAVKLTAKEVMP